ncbi:glycoside hydrolase family 47 protein [Reticulomyxa filosa]|uniref:alpha-1,2-Mannosidase n=1 Tax=Reticulomyxa filosa TaxID=46433 RepID=X6P3Z7_RETFI|nr:glycoside hydrolase family 47 protein [Reticulomyxa filosa]|eukprot:ETO33275.1 glycoside hydrolase family 47 protein [Reticulomyxa filosa]
MESEPFSKRCHRWCLDLRVKLWSILRLWTRLLKLLVAVFVLGTIVTAIYVSSFWISYEQLLDFYLIHPFQSTPNFSEVLKNDDQLFVISREDYQKHYLFVSNDNKEKERESKEQDQAQEQAEEIRKAFEFAYTHYVNRCIEYDEINAWTGECVNNMGGHSLTLIDSLSTLYVMNFSKEFEQAVDYIIDKIDWSFSPLRAMAQWDKHKFVDRFIDNGFVSMFEMNIRYIGGLLSAFDMSGDVRLLQKAYQLIQLFEYNHRWYYSKHNQFTFIPAKSIHLSFPFLRSKPFFTKQQQEICRLLQKSARYMSVPLDISCDSVNSLASMGSYQMEYSYMSHVTKKDTYKEIVDNIRDHIFANYEEWTKGDRYHLLSGIINANSGEMWKTHEHEKLHHINAGRIGFGIGSGADSFYEYLWKGYLQRKNKYSDDKLTWLYTQSMSSLLQSELWHVMSQSQSVILERDLEHTQHLTCFVGGLMALTAMEWNNTLWSNVTYWHMTPKQRVEKQSQWKTTPLTKDIWLKQAEAYAMTCANFYLKSPSGLSAHEFLLASHSSSSLKIDSKQNFYMLTPEVVETLFYLWRYTHDPKYRHFGWAIFKSIVKHCKTHFGFNPVRDVHLAHPQVMSNRSMPSFFLSETLKYLYLLFLPDHVLPLDRIVFTTEGHPLRRFK